MKALVAGPSKPAAALGAELAERGIETERYEAPDPADARAVATLAAALVALEARLESGGPALAIAVGSGDAPTALAVTAAKLGVPLAAWAGADGDSDAELDRAELRIIATLAACDAGAVPAEDAAERIASWALLDLAA